ncbi:MAG TPA: transcription factor RcaD [Cyanobacteria bacterium UBA11149]|nr:transcription factor RcaD [Cyanobacteria bacterium UBA11367]HBE58179.1 transcription factor RcaD [Cyanobacteria bacterium UBA11366]HBK64918.1 transcription factor RcaD [Cyanobacteria bacterium UBA11166]HBR74175.1 transcription factor RcaD [Cyanobacteria bacterium UBA11159]HBS70195.1 transcription factor RcaD [Cyanobacteria bacterium UBA11153]HBW89019.1 transcription factor RcaD [Cyanobacteria bacterium UBA11149]
METNELKFLLILLGCSDYRSPLAAKWFDSIKSKEKIVGDLGERGLVDFDRGIASVKILPPGQAIIEGTEESTLTPKQLRILENISKAVEKIAPSKVAGKSIKSSERDAILHRFQEQGLVEIEMAIKRQKAEVWLTHQGEAYLRDEFVPVPGTNPVFSFNLMTNYINFFRKFISKSDHPSLTDKLSDEQVLQIIQDLDRELGTENYLPIFHLREKLQPPFYRKDLDKVLYRLQEEDKIEMSSLQEASAYTPEQIDAGIPQDVGGSLFFISVN